MVALGNRVSEQLSRLGIPAEMMGAQLGNLSPAKLAALSNDLRVSFGAAALAGNKFMGETQDARWNIAPALYNPTPKESARDRGAYIRPSYYRARAPRHETARDPFPGLLNKYTKRGVIMSRMLHRDPVAKKAFERQAGLQIIPDGRTDGAVSVAVSAMNAGGSSGVPSGGGVPASFWDLFMQMDQSVMAEAARLGNIATAGADIYGTTAYATGGNPGGYYGGMGGSGAGGTDGYFASGGFSPTGENSVGSTDEQVLVIKRMMDKRNQMYDLFKNVLDKHNESAKTAIGNMRA